LSARAIQKSKCALPPPRRIDAESDPLSITSRHRNINLDPTFVAQTPVAASKETREPLAFALFLDRVIFVGLLLVLTLTAIPYGTVEPWSEALFESGLMLLAALWLVQGLFSGQWLPRRMQLFYPLIALVALAWVQSMVWWQTNAAGEKVWYAISADPFETRRFALKLLALTLAGILLARYTTNKKRLSALVHLIIIVAVVSAVFGIFRQSLQHDQGFVLPFLRPTLGYGQFTNRNHFAFFMEMAIGLVAGLMVVRSRKRERLPLYAAIMLALWTALVLSNSRGGLLAMIVQVIVVGLILSLPRGDRTHSKSDEQGGRLSFLRSTGVRIGLLAAAFVIVVSGVIWIGGDPLATTLENSPTEIGAVDRNELHLGVRRRDIWKSTLSMFKAHPLAGAGFGGYWAEIPQYHDASGAFTPQQAHNDYLEVLASGGVIGLGLLIWFGVTLINRSYRALRSSRGFYNAICIGAIIGIIGVAVHSVFDFGLHITINAFIFVGLLAILSLENIDETRPGRKKMRSRHK
jgi:O-antigen ligase